MGIQALTSRRSEIENFFSKAKNAISLFLQSSYSLTQYLPGPFNHTTKPKQISPDKLLNLIRKQEAIRAVLEDAAVLQLSSKSDQHWMSELMDVVYLIDDVVDDFQFQALLFTRFKEYDNSLHECAGKKKKTQAKDLLSSAPSGSLADKIDLIKDRFHEIAYDRNALQLWEEDGAKIAEPSNFTPSGSQTVSNLIGRDHDMKKLTRLLQSDEESSKVSVISICGMAGVGKTTLVQHILQNQIEESSFNLTIWVCVSQIDNVVEISHEIVKCIEKGKHNCNSCILENLNDTITNHLREKKFLLVIDDLWDKAADNWDRLLAPLQNGAKGSKVIVTTRSMKTGRIICPKSYHLNCLSDDYCWTICREQAFLGRDSKLDPELEKIGRKIVAMCKGLPLAAMAIGVTLSFPHTRKHWNEVLHNFLIEDAMVKEVLPALRVTYEFLPLNLKQCFAYCSLFPKGYVYRKDMLVQLWMAQDFISTTRSSDLESVGSKYFVDLLDRCFFQHLPSYYPGEDRYLMHDLYHELAQVVSAKEINRIEKCNMGELGKVRHLSIAPQNHPGLEEVIQVSSIRWKYWSNWNGLRSFLLFGEQEQQAVPPRINISHKIFMSLECLRSLDLSNTDLESPPSDIGNLIHLRYLSFQNSRIRCLPESIGRLFKLQTLNLERCFQLKELPMGIKLLENLRHLYLPLSGDREILMPNGMMQMTDLQTLSLFSVRYETEDCNIQELGNLLNLKGKMHISGLNNIINPQFAEKAYMQRKGEVQNVTFEWSASDSTSCLDGKCASEVLEQLKPHSNTEELCIMGFCGTQFPSWLRNQHLQNLSILALKGCKHAEKLPPLGQLPSLMHLSIQNMTSLKQIGSEFCGFHASSCSSNQCNKSFPKLETLNFKKMYAWENWADINNGDFHSLKYLTLNECNALKKVPEFHDSLIIKIKNCLLLKAKEPEPRNQQPNSLETSKTSRVCLILSECGSWFDELTESYQSGNTKRKCPFTGGSQASASITIVQNNSSHAQILKHRRKMEIEETSYLQSSRHTT